MGQLIDDLLAFSRVGRHELRRVPVDMGTLARRTFEQLVPEDRRGAIDFIVDPLPGGDGDPSLLRQVWVNLLSNALKFSAPTARPAIHVGGRSQDGQQVYFVQDNGAGFDMRYADKLFGVFQRLHAAREFEGTGIGLAIVQRIVSRHGGRAWAEGAVGAGATFYFALPQPGGDR
jgi:light-regulated signal transduction histidine kinase (bacteriophytochrome)